MIIGDILYNMMFYFDHSAYMNGNNWPCLYTRDYINQEDGFSKDILNAKGNLSMKLLEPIFFFVDP